MTRICCFVADQLDDRVCRERPRSSSRAACPGRACAPSAIQCAEQSRSTARPAASALPPTCGTAPVGFSSIRLSSGEATVDAAGGEVVGQRAEVEERVVAAQRQLEAVLAVLRRRGRCRRCSRAATAPASRRGRSRRGSASVAPATVDRHARRSGRRARASSVACAVGLGPDQARVRETSATSAESSRLDHAGHVDARRRWRAGR